MSNLPAITAIESRVAERSADPAEFVIVACERAKAWLAEILADGAIEEIVEAKSQAEAIRVYTVQKGLGKDAELAAQEIVRRAERGIGLAIRRGQEAGEIVKKGQGAGAPGVDRHDKSMSKLRDVVPVGEWRGNAAGIVHMTDGVTQEQFETAIEEAKGEGNLSRANVVRKVKGTAPAPQRSEFNYGRRRIDYGRVLNEALASLDGLAMGLRLIDVETIPDAAREEWGRLLGEALRPLNQFKREITR